MAARGAVLPPSKFIIKNGWRRELPESSHFSSLPESELPENSPNCQELPRNCQPNCQNSGLKSPPTKTKNSYKTMSKLTLLMNLCAPCTDNDSTGGMSNSAEGGKGVHAPPRFSGKWKPPPALRRYRNRAGEWTAPRYGVVARLSSRGRSLTHRLAVEAAAPKKRLPPRSHMAQT